jgi:hypothetical protein
MHHLGELLIIVEYWAYCRYGNQQTYLSKHLNSFIVLLDDFGIMKTDSVSRTHEKWWARKSSETQDQIPSVVHHGCTHKPDCSNTNKAPIVKCRVGEHLVSSSTHKGQAPTALRVLLLHVICSSAAVLPLVRLWLNDKMPSGN